MVCYNWEWKDYFGEFGGSMIGTVLFILWGAWIIWDLFLGPTSLSRSHRQIMAHMRRKNAKRGITMRPGWQYHLPDGRIEMSWTGKLKDRQFI